MSELANTTRMCPNGHVLQLGWEVCPHCPSTRALDPLPPTIRLASAGAAGASPAAEPAGARRTEVLGRPLALDAVAWLVAADAARRGQVLQIDRPRTTVGAAATSDLVIDEPHVSGRHAAVRFVDRRFVVVDLGSSNGTWVNGDEIDERDVRDGDRVRFGGSEWIFKCVVFDGDASDEPTNNSTRRS
jgi:hypothetical protein